MIIYGYFQLFLAIFGYFTISYFWLFQVIFGYFSLFHLRAIFDYYKKNLAIVNNFILGYLQLL
jgi:hypothetical protein